MRLLSGMLACGGAEPELGESVTLQSSELPQVAWEGIRGVELLRTTWRDDPDQGDLPLLGALLGERGDEDATIEQQLDFEVEPIVVDEEGAELELLDESWHDRELGWGIEGGWQPGVTYQLVGGWTVGGVELLLDEPLDFEVGEHGRVEGHKLRPGTWALVQGQGLEWGLLDLMGAAFLELVEVREDEVDFRVVMWPSEAEPCAVLVASAERSELGELRWSQDELLAGSEPEETTLRELSLRLGFDRGGEEARGVEATAVVDLRVADQYLDPDYQPACGLVAGFGMRCESCPDDGEEQCLPVMLERGVLQPAEQSFADELPMCGYDLDANLGDLPTFDFEIDCDCSTVSPRAMGWWALGLLLVLRRRRR